MARPQRNNVDYFPFFCKEGKSMFYIEQKYGNDGFATWVKILRELALADYHYLNLSDEINTMYLSAKCKIDKIVLENIVNDLVKLGHFDSELWNENQIIFSEKFVESVSDAYKKRSNEIICKKTLLVLLISLGIRKPSKGESKPRKGQSKAPVNPQSKEEKSKEEENKEEEIFDFKKSFENLGVEKSNLDAWLKVRKLKRGVNSEPAFDLIKKEIEKSGFSANECIKMAAAKSWSGFKAEWMDENKKKEYALDTIREWYNLGDLNEKLSFKKFGEFLAKTKHLKYLRFDIAKDDVMKKIVEVNQEFGSSDNIYYEMAKYDNENERSMKNVFYKSYKKAI